MSERPPLLYAVTSGRFAHPLWTANGDLLRVEQRPWRENLLVITVDGELDLSSAGQLERVLWQDLPRCTVLDLSGVTFLGATGFRPLENAADRAHLEHRRIGVVASTRPILRVLRMFGLDTRLPIYARLADAVRELAQ